MRGSPREAGGTCRRGDNSCRTYAVEYGDSQATASNSSRKAMGNCVSPIMNFGRAIGIIPIEPLVLINHFILEVPPSSRGEPSRPVARPFGSTVGMGTLDEASVSLVFIDFAHAIGIRRADTEVCPYRHIAP